MDDRSNPPRNVFHHFLKRSMNNCVFVPLQNMSSSARKLGFYYNRALKRGLQTVKRLFFANEVTCRDRIVLSTMRCGCYSPCPSSGHGVHIHACFMLLGNVYFTENNLRKYIYFKVSLLISFLTGYLLLNEFTSLRLRGICKLIYLKSTDG